MNKNKRERKKERSPPPIHPLKSREARAKPTDDSWGRCQLILALLSVWLSAVRASHIHKQATNINKPLSQSLPDINNQHQLDTCAPACALLLHPQHPGKSTSNNQILFFVTKCHPSYIFFFFASFNQHRRRNWAPHRFIKLN